MSSDKLRWIIATLWLMLLWAAVLFEPSEQALNSSESLWGERLPELERVELERPGERVVITRTARGEFWVKLVSGQGELASVRESMADVQITAALFEALRGLKVERELAQGSALSTFGLAPSQRATVTIWPSTHQPVKLWIGSEAVGHQELYAQRPERPDQVLILKAQALRSLRFASTRLPSRALTSLTRERLDGIRLSRPQTSALTLVQRHKDDVELAYWAWELREGSSRLARAWSSDALRLRHLAQVVEEPVEGLEEQLRWELLVAGVAREQVVLYQDAQGRWLARSDQTLKRLVRLDEVTAKALFARALTLWQQSQTEALGPAPKRHADGHVH